MANVKSTIDIIIGTVLKKTGIDAAKAHMREFAAGVGRNLMNIKAGWDMLSGSVSRVASVMRSALMKAFDVEDALTGFRTMLGSAEAATKMVSDLRAFAARTPLTFGDLSGATRTLLAFGSTAEEIMPDLKMLGDISLGNSQRFRGLALVFGQVKAAGRLMGQDLLQMINQGFNPLTEISKATGKSIVDLKKDMESGVITFDLVRAAMQQATSEGGRFNNAMENASTTGRGLVSTLQDNWTMAVAEFGSAFTDAAKNGIGFMIEKLQQLNKDGSIRGWAEDTVAYLESAVGAFRKIGEGASYVWKTLKTIGAKPIALKQGLEIGNELGLKGNDLTNFAQKFQQDVIDEIRNGPKKEAAEEDAKVVNSPNSAAIDVKKPEPVGVDVKKPKPVGVDVKKPEPVGVDVRKPSPVAIDVKKPEPVKVEGSAVEKKEDASVYEISGLSDVVHGLQSIVVGTGAYLGTLAATRSHGEAMKSFDSQSSEEITKGFYGRKAVEAGVFGEQEKIKSESVTEPKVAQPEPVTPKVVQPETIKPQVEMPTVTPKVETPAPVKATVVAESPTVTAKAEPVNIPIITPKTVAVKTTADSVQTPKVASAETNPGNDIAKLYAASKQAKELESVSKKRDEALKKYKSDAEKVFGNEYLQKIGIDLSAAKLPETIKSDEKRNPDESEIAAKAARSGNVNIKTRSEEVGEEFDSVSSKLDEARAKVLASFSKIGKATTEQDFKDIKDRLDEEIKAAAKIADEKRRLAEQMTEIAKRKAIDAARDEADRKIELLEEVHERNLRAIEEEMQKNDELSAKWEDNAKRARGGKTFGDWNREQTNADREARTTAGKQERAIASAKRELERLEKIKNPNASVKRKIGNLNQFLEDQDPKNNPFAKRAKEIETQKNLAEQNMRDDIKLIRKTLENKIGL